MMARAQAGAQAQGGVVAGYRLVVPGGWFAVDLDPGRREWAVAALVERQFAGVDNAPHLKAQARRELLARAKAAYAAGGLEMFLYMQQVAGIPLAASLVIFLVPQPGSQAVTAEKLAGSLAGEGRQVRVADLPAGTAVRVLWRTGPADEAAATALEVFVPVPRGCGWLLLSFSAPLGPLAPAMMELFDAIAATLRWDQ
jgi:hypothetical protein